MRRRPLPAPAGLALVLLLAAGCGGGPSPEVERGGIPLTEVLDGLMTRTQRALTSIGGLESADAAGPRLEAIGDDFYDLRYHAAKLSDEGQRELAEHAAKQHPRMRAMVATVMDSPVLAEKIGQPMSTILAHLEALMAPPYKEPEG